MFPNYPVKENMHDVIHIELSATNAFSLEKSEIVLSGTRWRVIQSNEIQRNLVISHVDGL